MDEAAAVSERGAVEDRHVNVSHADPCRLANSVGAMMHDLENGKRKYLHEEIKCGGRHDHRCRPCREWDIGYRVPEIKGSAVWVSRSRWGVQSNAARPMACRTLGTVTSGTLAIAQWKRCPPVREIEVGPEERAYCP